MSESKAENIILVFIAIFLTGFFSGVFQNNLIMIIFNLVGFLISLTIYIFGYPLRKKLVSKFMKPLKRIISDLELYDKIKDDPKLERKVINRLYKNFKLVKLLEGHFIITTSNSPLKPFFEFQKERENPLFKIQFWISSGDNPFQFHMESKKENVHYYSKKIVDPNRTIEEKQEDLKKLMAILREFHELI